MASFQRLLGRPDVKYRVSDFLKDRHPYCKETGFRAQAVRDKGLVFDGFGHEGGVSQQLNYLLQDTKDVSVKEKAKALQFLIARAAAAENKLRLLRANVVPIVSRLCKTKPLDPLIATRCAQLLRTLCALPQGRHAVCVQGGLNALTHLMVQPSSYFEAGATGLRRSSTTTRSEQFENKNSNEQAGDRAASGDYQPASEGDSGNGDDRHEERRALEESSRTEAVAAIQLLASSWDGRLWLLGKGEMAGHGGLREMTVDATIVGIPDLDANDKPTNEEDEDDTSDDTLGIESDFGPLNTLPTAQQRESLAQAVMDALIGVCEESVSAVSGDDRHLEEWHHQHIMNRLRLATDAVALLCYDPRGVQLALISGAINTMASVLSIYGDCSGSLNSTTSSNSRLDWARRAAEGDISGERDASVVLHSSSVIWHMAQDVLARKEATELPLIQILGDIIACLLDVPSHIRSICLLKTTLCGAVAALALHPPVKTAACEPIVVIDAAGDSVSMLDLQLKLVVQGHDLYNSMLHHGSNVAHNNRNHGSTSSSYTNTDSRVPAAVDAASQEQVAALVKNATQAIRLIAEYPEARQSLHKKIPPSNNILRRNLFYNTDYMKEFGVKTV